MKLRAISRFIWRGTTFEIGDEVLCPDPIIANRLMAEGNVESVTKLDPPAAQKPITQVGDQLTGAEVPAAGPTPKQQVSKGAKKAPTKKR